MYTKVIEVRDRIVRTDQFLAKVTNNAFNNNFYKSLYNAIRQNGIQTTDDKGIEISRNELTESQRQFLVNKLLPALINTLDVTQNEKYFSENVAQAQRCLISLINNPQTHQATVEGLRQLIATDFPATKGDDLIALTRRYAVEVATRSGQPEATQLVALAAAKTTQPADQQALKARVNGRQ